MEPVSFWTSVGPEYGYEFTRCVKIDGLGSVFIDFDIQVLLCPVDMKAIHYATYVITNR